VSVELADKIRARVPAAIARGITWCERGGADADELLATLPRRSAHVIGLTGAPGAGKSTLVSALVGAYRAADRAVAVLAVDPSSPMSGGALLGDRARLELPPGDRGMFFRSLASRGASGGLADATWAATTVLSAAGFDPVIVETVGAGQAEVSIMRIADTVALVLQPGAGDELQAMKAGLMEIANVYVLNKADQAGLAELRAQVVGEIGSYADGWRRPILETVATRGEGAAAVLAAADAHRAHLHEHGGPGTGEAGRWAEAMRVARVAFERELQREHPRSGDGIGEWELGRRLAERAAERLLARSVLLTPEA
jgi:LAO/AO transport system kinase